MNPFLKEDKVVIEKTYPIADPSSMTVIVDNIQGDVVVEATEGRQVELLLEIWIEADSDRDLAKAKSELKLGEQVSSDSLVFYTEAPFIKRTSWGSGWSNNININMEALGYDFKYQYTVKVPNTVTLDAHTINKGDVLVKDVDGPVKACNVNGSVEIENARQVIQASTVNGDLTINFLENPRKSVGFQTVNGDFNLTLPSDFAAKIFFDSMHGELYTAFDYQELRPRIENSNEHGKFKIGSKTGIEIGKGGPQLSFKSVNGDVYLKKSALKGTSLTK